MNHVQIDIMLLLSLEFLRNTPYDIMVWLSLGAAYLG